VILAFTTLHQLTLLGSKELVQELGGLPLALAQAGSYIHQTNYDVIGYLSLYRETWSTLFESNRFLPLRDLGGRSILTTWTLSYEAIQLKCPDAAQMLQLWSYFDHGDLWYGLFTPLLSVATTLETKLPEWYAQVVSSPTNFNVVIQALLSYSLAKPQPTPLAYSVHPVVHQWCYHKTVKDRNATARLALIILGSAVPQQTNQNYWVVERRLLPHCNHLHKVMKDMPIASLKEYGGNNLLLHSYLMLGNLYRNQGKLKEAEEMYQLTLKGYEKAWGSEHTSTLDTVNNLGVLYSGQGKLKEAEEMYQRALKGKEKAWGSEHPSTLDTVNNLGILYSGQGKLKEAEEMYQRALKGYEKAWGSEHTSMLDIVNNLGTLYRGQGKLKEAEKMYQRALKGYEKARGSNHPNTIRTARNLENLTRDSVSSKAT
jgi:tetratricopeptide (TPR) repeat protein